jgi:hypothetical protein
VLRGVGHHEILGRVIKKEEEMARRQIRDDGGGERRMVMWSDHDNVHILRTKVYVKECIGEFDGEQTRRRQRFTQVRPLCRR